MKWKLLYCRVWVLIWVAVKELNLSYYIGETILMTTYSLPNVVTEFKFLNSNPASECTGPFRV